MQAPTWTYLFHGTIAFVSTRKIILNLTKMQDVLSTLRWGYNIHYFLSNRSLYYTIMNQIGTLTMMMLQLQPF